MGTSDVLGIGLSGAMVANRGVATTSHNIANANTEGFTRQRVEVDTRPPQLTGVGAIGTGVTINNIKRVHNEFLTQELRSNASLFNALESNHDFTSQVDNMLANPDAGLSPTLHKFFDAINGVSNDPSSQSARQVLLGEANSLSERFKYLNNRFENLRRGANETLKSYIIEVNDLAKSIADMNEKIQIAKEVTQKEPSDLYDQRERLIQKLATKVDVRINEQDDGSYNVFVGNGQTLVLGERASTLALRQSKHDASQLEIVFKNLGTESVVTDFITGGAIGGLLDFRNNILDGAQNELGRLAIGVAKTFNDQHHRGMTLNNNLGDDFFIAVDKLAPQALPSVANKGDTELSVKITDIDNLTVSDYRLNYGQGKYTLVRLSDEKTIAEFTSLPQRFESEGFSIDQLRGTTIQEGDNFIIRPTRQAADSFGVQVEHTNDIAAAAPLRIRTSINNFGSAQAELSGVEDIDAPAFSLAKGTLSPTITVHFVDDQHFELLDDKGKVITTRQINDLNKAIPGTSGNPGDPGTPATPAISALPGEQHLQSDGQPATEPQLLESVINYDPRNGVNIFPTPAGYAPGYSIRLHGEAKAGDTFVIEFNKDAFGDNSNALALGALQNKPTLANGTSDYSEVYAQLVSRVGSKTHELNINREAQRVLFEQAKEEREATSGVNLDEEAANLMRYQEAYQANAQVVGTANKMFQVLLDMLGR